MMKVCKCDGCGCYFDNEKPVVCLNEIKLVANFCPECIRRIEKWVKMIDEAENEVKNDESLLCIQI